MASEDHKHLANNIKTVHKELRERVLKGEDAESVWKSHVENFQILNNYAQSMEKLATKYWLNEENSRVSWIYNQIENYFWSGGIFSEQLKDLKVAKKKGRILETPKLVNIPEKVNVLDVGSCYNPFNTFSDRLDVLPIDIAPANSQVFKCDFLHVKIEEKTVIENDTVKSLESDSFNVIIFCLLLEYLPAPDQRWRCVQKAFQLLKEEGLLCIVTPDSSHMGRNSQQLKSWRQGLSLLGLSKVSYEKSQHFHGLVYRKPPCPVQNIIREDGVNLLGENGKELFYIPQDFTTKICESPVNLDFTEEERDLMKESFSELPDIF